MRSPCRRCGVAGVVRNGGLYGLEAVGCILLFVAGEMPALIMYGRPVAVLLALAGLIPGIVFYAWRSSYPCCVGCGRRV